MVPRACQAPTRQPAPQRFFLNLGGVSAAFRRRFLVRAAAHVGGNGSPPGGATDDLGQQVPAPEHASEATPNTPIF